MKNNLQKIRLQAQSKPSILQQEGILNLLLLTEIYSPEILVEASYQLDTIPDFIKDTTPLKIKHIIEQIPLMSTGEIQKALDTYWTIKGRDVLKAYQNCPLPLQNGPFNNKHASVRHNILSKKGEKALAILENATKEQMFSSKTAQLGESVANKFLIDLRHYKSFEIDPNLLTRTYHEDNREKIVYPVLQLTDGCPNKCSHCLARAENKLSHMPYPLFLSLHKQLWDTYKTHPLPDMDHPSFSYSEIFQIFFDNSDLMAYKDPIIKADSGDISLYSTMNHAPMAFLSSGLLGKESEIAFSKVLYTGKNVSISFVDTPLENKQLNIKRLHQTLKVAEKMGAKDQILVVHYHLKSGPSVPDEVFLGFNKVEEPIFASGRAKNLPTHELSHIPDGYFTTPYVIKPNMDILKLDIQNGEYHYDFVNNLINPNSKKKITSQKKIMPITPTQHLIGKRFIIGHVTRDNIQIAQKDIENKFNPLCIPYSYQDHSRQ